MLTNRIAEIIAAADRVIHPEHYRLISLWRDLGSPHRPSREEIVMYRGFLGPVTPEDRILILGATPELRDLILRSGTQPFVADHSRQMLVSMQSLMIENPHGRETWIEKNWLDLDFPDHFFTGILGDLSLRHIDPKQQDAFLRKVCQWTRPDGTLILRVHAISPEHLGAYSSILQKNESFPARKETAAMGILLSRLYDASTKDKKIDYPKIQEKIITHLNLPMLFSYRLFLHKFLAKRIALFSKPLSSQTAEELENIFNAYCSILQIWSNGNYPEARHYPIYLLKPLK